MISVIMSVYNDSKYLKESIESVLNQTYQNFEFIIVDDFSSDISLSIIKEYVKKDHRVKLIRNKNNLGLAASLNKAWKIAKYDYIARMDSDDICFKNRFSEQMNYLLENPNISIIGTSVEYINENNQVISTVNRPETDIEIKNTLIKKNCMIHPSVILKKEVLITCNGYIEKLKNAAEDYDLWLNAMNKNYEFYNLQKPLLQYRIIYSNRSLKRIFFKFILQSKFVKKYNLPYKSYLYFFKELLISLLLKYQFYTPKTLKGKK